MHLLQISDIHLFKDPKGALLGCTTRDSFEAVVQAIKKENLAMDLILLTGDLSHDGSPESYLYLADALQELKCPVCWIPGNHDVSSTAHKVLGTTYFLKEKELTFKNWSFFLMNSQFEGEAYGYLAPEKIAELNYFLRKKTEKNVLISLHHQPIPVGSLWLDGVGLRNKDQFQEAIQDCKQLRAILFGHVHQAFDQEIGAVRYLGVPSTCIQFLPNHSEFQLDTLAPGYRYIKLNDNGSIETSVKRLENYISNVDLKAEGY